MKPEFMKLRRAIAVASATLLAAAGLAVLSPASSAMAHHNTLSVSASCVDYVWTVTWKVTNSERYKSEKIIESNQSDLVPVGTFIDKRDTFTVTETVAGPITKTLSVVGYWADGKVTDRVRSVTVKPSDFVGTCARPAPSPSPTPVETPKVTVEASACVFTNEEPSGTVTASFSDLAEGTKYTAKLWSDGTTVDSEEFTANAKTSAVSFAGAAPGTYNVSLASEKVAELTRSDAVTVVDCTPPAPTPAPVSAADPTPVAVFTPALESSIEPCVENKPLSAGVTVTASGLNPEATYYVVLVDDNGDALPGASEKTVTGSATQSITFPALVSASPITAEISTSSDRIVVATASAVTLPVCTGVLPAEILLPPADVPGGGGELPTLAVNDSLPTLAVTGPSELIPLGIFSALLLTLGGAVVVTRLRRRLT